MIQIRWLGLELYFRWGEPLLNPTGIGVNKWGCLCCKWTFTIDTKWFYIEILKRKYEKNS